MFYEIYFNFFTGNDNDVSTMVVEKRKCEKIIIRIEQPRNEETKNKKEENFEEIIMNVIFNIFRQNAIRMIIFSINYI